MISDIKKLLKNIKQNMPAIIVGISCWFFAWYLSGTSCWIRAVFGIPCPGCGSTRAVGAVFRGNIPKALEYHPLIFLTLGLLFYWLITVIFRIKIFEKLGEKRFNIIMWVVLGLYISVYIIRMILLFPVTEPMIFLESSLLWRIVTFIRNIF